MGDQLHQESWPAKGDFYLQNIQTPRVQCGMEWVSLNSSPLIDSSVTVTLTQSWVKLSRISHHDLRTATNPESVQLQISDRKVVRARGPDGQGGTQKDKRTKEAEKILSAKMDSS